MTLKKIVFFVLFTFFSLNSFSETKCVPARVYIDYPQNMRTGMYYRYSPDGMKVIVSNGTVDGESNMVGLIKIEEGKDGKLIARAIPTRMGNEAYPVEGMRNSNGQYSWRIITAPYDKNSKGMGFYRADGKNKKNNIFLGGMDTKRFHLDNNHDEYYHSAGTIPGTNKFKILLWQDLKIKNYEVSFKSSLFSKEKKMVIKEASKSYSVCKNITNVSGPILSKDAAMISLTEESGTSIYWIDNKTGNCELIKSLGYQTGKVSFNYPDQKEVIAFNSQASYLVDGVVKRDTAVFTYDYSNKDINESDRTKLISDPSEGAVHGYAGMLADGRVMYMKKNIVNGLIKPELVIADPDQINSDGSVNLSPEKCVSIKSKTSGSTFSSSESQSSEVIKE